MQSVFYNKLSYSDTEKLANPKTSLFVLLKLIQLCDVLYPVSFGVQYAPSTEPPVWPVVTGSYFCACGPCAVSSSLGSAA